MPLETGTTISDLVATNPDGSDPVNQGDDHLRLIKSVLKNQFPGTGNGLTKPLIPTADEFNTLDGIDTTQTIQNQINNIEGNSALSAPPGTIMLFHNGNTLQNEGIPAGWTLYSIPAGSVLRAVNSAGGATGAGQDPQSIYFEHTHGGGVTGSHSLLAAQIPAHTHRMFVNIDSDVDLDAVTKDQNSSVRNTGTAGDKYQITASTSFPGLGKTEDGQTDGLGFTGAQAGGHQHIVNDVGVTINLKYVNIVLGEKV